LPKDKSHSPGFSKIESKTPDISNRGLQFAPQVDMTNND